MPSASLSDTLILSRMKNGASKKASSQICGMPMTVERPQLIGRRRPRVVRSDVMASQPY
ncbi:hypothetical protein GALL_446100 [mine drainage metagenome]|uniref:Uncharacterized protein n=1 Tax=mine drainage metagenome TaxID=410659 RepID=A0A1J5Q1K1_9ZZZZ